MAALVCAGCSVFGPAVPTSEFTAQLGPAQSVKWSNPKNFVTTNLAISFGSNGQATVSIGFASSMNDAAIVNAGYGGQAALVKQWGDTAMQLMQAGAAAAAKGAAK